MTSPATLARRPWREAIRRIIAGCAGGALMAAGIVDLLGGGITGRAADHHHPGWVPVTVIGFGAMFVVLALDFESRVVGFLRGLPWPWGRSRKDDSGTWVRIPRKDE